MILWVYFHHFFSISQFEFHSREEEEEQKKAVVWMRFIKMHWANECEFLLSGPHQSSVAKSGYHSVNHSSVHLRALFFYLSLVKWCLRWAMATGDELYDWSGIININRYVFLRWNKTTFCSQKQNAEMLARFLLDFNNVLNWYILPIRYGH